MHIMNDKGEIVEAAGGNFHQLSIKGGVVAVHIQWICNLDYDFLENCLPRYSFSLIFICSNSK